MKFIHLTDTHLVAEGETLLGNDPAERLRGAVVSINAEHSDAAFVVITGDLTDQGRAGEYAAFRREIAALGMPVHCLLGNHDNRDAFLAAFPEVRPDPHGFVQSAFDTTVGRFILTDTHVPGSDSGDLCAARLAWLKDQLSTSAHPVFLFLHHPPMPLGLPSLDNIPLVNPDALFAVLEPALPRIRHLFFGHAHRPIWGTWRGIPYSCMRGMNHQIALDMTVPVDIFPANSEPPAYGVVLVSDDQITVHMHDYTSGGDTFEA